MDISFYVLCWHIVNPLPTQYYWILLSHVITLKFLSFFNKVLCWYNLTINLSCFSGDRNFCHHHTFLCFWEKWDGRGINGRTFRMHLVAGFCHCTRDQVSHFFFSYTFYVDFLLEMCWKVLSARSSDSGFYWKLVMRFVDIMSNDFIAFICKLENSFSN